MIDKAGRRIAVEFIVRTMLRDGERMRMTIVRDIRDRQAAQARIHHLAHHDALTGLPNRMSFMEQLRAPAWRRPSPRARGWRCCSSTSTTSSASTTRSATWWATRCCARWRRASQASLRATDVVARFGGDEFMVLLHGGPSQGQQRDDVDEVAHKLLSAIEVPVTAEGRPISVTPSIGIAFFPGDGELARRTGQERRQRRCTWPSRAGAPTTSSSTAAWPTAPMPRWCSKASSRRRWSAASSSCTSSRRCACATAGWWPAEALMRWNHPERGLLMPDEFIPVAERQRLMLQHRPVGAEGGGALRAALARAWGWACSPVAVNLSTVQFQSAGFVEAVAQVLADDGDCARPPACWSSS